jgi:hypothetical protein
MISDWLDYNRNLPLLVCNISTFVNICLPSFVNGLEPRDVKRVIVNLNTF